MKAIVHTQYGSPDVPGVLQFKEVETPLPTDHQLLIKVHAAFVNARDGHLVKSQPALLRLIVGSGLLKPKDQKLGADIAGQVEAIGNTVTQFQIGDEVFGVGVGGFTDITQQDLWVVKALLEVGTVVPVIERRYPLGETAEALRYLEAGHTRGKVVITAGQNSQP